MEKSCVMALKPNGLLKCTFYVRPDQYRFLKDMALDLVEETGKGFPDGSMVLRALIDIQMEHQAALKSAQSEDKPKVKRKRK